MMSKSKNLVSLGLLSAWIGLSSCAMASKNTYTPSIIHNGAALMVYSQHGFGPSTTDRSEVDNLIAYLKQSPMNQVNIIYLDGFDVSSGTGSNPSTVPTLQAFPNYAYAVEQLHEMGKTVILVSALSDGDVNLNSGTVVSDLETIVSNTPNGIHADGLAFDDEISKANQLYFADNQAALATLAQNEVAQKKYFGIVTNLGGSQEGAIAPLFDNVTCQANANATDYCFESIMRYDGGDGTPEQASLKYEMHPNFINLLWRIISVIRSLMR